MSAGLAAGCRLAEALKASFHEHRTMTMMHTAQVAILQTDALLWDHAHGVVVW